MDLLFVKQYGLEKIHEACINHKCTLQYFEKGLKIKKKGVITDKIGVGFLCNDESIAEEMIGSLFEYADETKYIEQLKAKIKDNNYTLHTTSILYGKELYNNIWRKEIYLRYKLDSEEHFKRALSFDLDTCEESDYDTIEIDIIDYISKLKFYFTDEFYNHLYTILSTYVVKHKNHIIKTNLRYEFSIYFTIKELFSVVREDFIKLIRLLHNIDITTYLNEYIKFPYLALFSLTKEMNKDIQLCLYFRDVPN